METMPAIGLTSLTALILVIIWAKPIFNRKKRNQNYIEDSFLNWDEDTHQRAAAGRDGWDEDWYPHETL